jgi:CheY-like chemotaxis protein
MSKKGPILLIEDDEDDQMIISQVIRDLGISNPIQVFYNGKEALDHLEKTQEQPFLILCDVNMPVLNGLELRHLISQSEYLRKKSIPFVFLTTTASPEAVRQAYNDSVQGFYQKANSYAEFQEQIKLIITYWEGCLHPNRLF